MINIFRDIKVVGFDLDQTLYQNTPDIHQTVRAEIYRTMSVSLGISVEEAQQQFEDSYAQTHSGGRSLEQLGVPNGREVLRDCLFRADISHLLDQDLLLQGMMRTIREQFPFLFLATESRKDVAERKLHALGISLSLFDYTAFWDTTALRKDENNLFPDVVRSSGYPPEQHLYCGDKVNDDILPAKRAGFRAVLVGSDSREADLCIPTIHDLERYLR
jgi:FMN phosphatase YigB (HAD superfamily)